MTRATADHDLAQAWIHSFGHALEQQSRHTLRPLLAEDSHWRDIAVFTRDLFQVSGTDAVLDALMTRTSWADPHSFRISDRFSPPTWQDRQGVRVLEAFFEFEVGYGRGVGIVRLIPDASSASGLRAWVVLTRIDGLAGVEPLGAAGRPKGTGFDRQGGRVTWGEHRSRRLEYADHDPDVLIVGAGQAGVMLAAHLERLGVDYVVAERHGRMGDNWRLRYDSLTLHNMSDVVQFPFLPFPDTFPEYLPKDKLANWFEAYAESLELNILLSHELESARFDDEAGRWDARVRAADGRTRTLHPRHIVMTAGGTGVIPRIAVLPGLEDFTGAVLHSASYTSGVEYAGKKVLVIGAGTSAHDLAYDLTLHGADVAMVQRGTISVTTLDSANMLYSAYTQGVSTEEADLVSAAGWIEPLQRAALQSFHAAGKERDREFLAALSAAGLALDDGPHDTGWVRKFWTASGYYIDVGCSQLIIDGTIRVIPHATIDRFAPRGVRLQTGEAIDVDVVIMATGFEDQHSVTRSTFGPDVADRVGEMQGYDERGEVRNIYRPTAQRGLWFGAGGIHHCRTFSPVLALQLKADLVGLVSAHPAS